MLLQKLNTIVHEIENEPNLSKRREKMKVAAELLRKLERLK